MGNGPRKLGSGAEEDLVCTPLGGALLFVRRQHDWKNSSRRRYRRAARPYRSGSEIDDLVFHISLRCYVIASRATGGAKQCEGGDALSMPDGGVTMPLQARINRKPGRTLRTRGPSHSMQYGKPVLWGSCILRPHSGSLISGSADRKYLSFCAEWEGAPFWDSADAAIHA